MNKLFSIVFSFFMFSTTFGQNKLDKSKKALTAADGAKNRTSTSSSNTSSSRNSSDGNDNILVKAVAEVFIYATYGVFKYGVVGDYKKEDHLYNTLSPYPFYNGKSGNYIDNVNDTVKKSQFRFDVEDSFLYNSSNLMGNLLKVKIRPFQYFYLQTDFHQLFEFDKIDHAKNRLSLFHFNMVYDRIRLEKFNFGWTIGASYVGNEVKKAGFSYGLNAEYFMGNHISFMASAKWSKINFQPVNVYEIQSRFHGKKHFFSLGFEHLKIAAPTYNFIALGGGYYF